MTETEAKTKWCPMARVMLVRTHQPTGVVESFGAVNQHTTQAGGETNIITCIGSGCMMWRATYDSRLAGGGFSARLEKGEVSGGYCGLAGGHA